MKINTKQYYKQLLKKPKIQPKIRKPKLRRR